MNVAFDESSKKWTARISCLGQTVKITADDDYSADEVAAVFEKTRDRLNELKAAIHAKLIESLHELYNDVWSDPDEGFPELSPAEFLAKIQLDGISIWEEETAMLWFADGDLFGGHTIELLVEADGSLGDAGLIG